MAAQLQLLRLSHVNALVDGYRRSLDHLGGTLGMQVNMEIPAREGDDTDACLLSLGDVIFELFAPRQRAERGQGRLLALYGGHYLGAEFQVPDLEAARSVCRSRNVRIIRDDGYAFFTYPGACSGISWEIFDGDWHSPPHGGTAGDVVTNPDWTPIHTAAYWRDEHPLGVVGLARLRVAVADLDAALEGFQSLTGAAEIDRPSRPEAKAIDLQVCDTVFELLAPAGDGPLAEWLTRYREGVRSTVFRVHDLDRVERFAADRGFDLVPGDASDAWAFSPEQSLDLRFEFTE